MVTKVKAPLVEVEIDGTTTNLSAYLNVDDVETYAALQAIDVSTVNAYRTINVAERISGTGRGGGDFYWLQGDKTAEITSDPLFGRYVPPASDLTGATGVWVRKIQGEISLESWEISDSADSTTAAQAAINFCTPIGLPLRWAPIMVDIRSTLTLYPNTRIYLPVDGGLLTSFGMIPTTGGITFSPTSSDDLFDFAAYPGDTDYTYYTNISIRGLWLKAGNTNARYAFYLRRVIESTFSVGMEGFVAGSYHDGTINNAFERCTYSDMTSTCVFLRNISTTDVFDTCRFQQSPRGFDSIGSVCIRAVNCLFEQIANYGAVISNTCRGFQFDTCYAEDVPYSPTVATTEAAMFNVAEGVSPAQTATSLIVTGGVYNGQNSATIGSLLKSDYMNGAVISNVECNRFTQLFKTTANTSDRSIFCSGISGVTWTLATDTAKLQGITPGAAQFGGSGLPHNAYLNVLYSSTHRPRPGTTGINIDADSVTVKQLWTDTRTANTNTPSGATVSSMPVYSSSGTLVGYMPIYATPW